MKREKIIYEGKEIEVESFDRVIHLNRGKKHALKDIDKLLREDVKNKRLTK